MNQAQPLFHSPIFPSHSLPALPHPFLEAPTSPVIIPALHLIPMPHSQSRTPSGSGAQGWWAPADAQPLQPVPAGHSVGPPLAWMGCCLLTKKPAQQGPAGAGSHHGTCTVVCLCPALQTVLLSAPEHTPGSREAGGGGTEVSLLVLITYICCEEGTQE